MNHAAMLDLLGEEGRDLLTHRCSAIPKDTLHLPSADFMGKVFVSTNRNVQTLNNIARIFGSGRLGGTGYLSILPLDHGVEHGAGYSFASNPAYFDPEEVMTLALEGGCNAVATTIGALAIVARNFAHKIPFIAKLNHNELLSYPNRYDQVRFASAREAWNLGAAAIGATIYFGSEESSRQITEVSQLFEEAHGLGMATVLWCYLRNPAFRSAAVDYHLSADLTGQANYLGATLQADFVKQKLPENNGGFRALSTPDHPFGKYNDQMYGRLSTNHPIDLCRYQVANGFMGRVGLISSGGSSGGQSDFKDAVRAAVINKRAGGMGLIAGRKSFQRPLEEGIRLLQDIQDVYLDPRIDIA